MSVRMSLVRAVLQKQFNGWEEGTIEEQRTRQERTVRLSRKLPAGVRFEEAVIEGMPAAWFHPETGSRGTMLYLHGGAYCLGSMNTHRELTARLAKTLHCSILLLEYRLAPENPFPAALDDARSAWRWLYGQSMHTDNIFLAGDSAGGGLALSLMSVLRDADEPLPAGAVLLSPWTDLTLSGDSVVRNAKVDPVLNQEKLQEKASLYAGSHPAADPRISPLFAEMDGLPPILFQVGSDEILRDDSVRAAEKAEKAGVNVTLQLFDDVFHVFHMVPFLPQTITALENIREFLDSCTVEQSPPSN